MKKILITGKNSYIGNALAARLSQQPDRYLVSAVSLRDGALERCDFRGADAVVHVAAVVHQKDKSTAYPKYAAVNRDLAAAAARKAKSEGVKQFIFLSSMSVYGRDTGVITKETRPDPRSSYGLSKLEGELAVASLADGGFTVTILRPPMVFGPGAKGNYRRLEKLAGIIPLCPQFENRRSMVSVDTLCRDIQALLDDPRSGVFFPQEAEPVCTAELIARIAREQGRTLKTTRLFNPAIRVLRKITRAGRKAFGDLVYENLEMLPLSEVFPKEARP